ncbi:MAG: ABC transporter permease [Planctomycetota bacterium]
MKYALLVALREYAENAKTKGFWIGLFIFPVLIYMSVEIQTVLSKATPTRYIALNDQSGRYGGAIEAELEWLHRRDVFRAFGEYVRKHSKAPADAAAGRPSVDLEKIRAVDPSALLDKFADTNRQAVEQFFGEGGVQGALASIPGLLEEDRPPFEEPDRRYRLVPMPKLSAPDDPKKAAQEMKEYLTGERSIEVDGKERELFAYVQIPMNVAESVVRPNQLATTISPTTENRGVEYWATNLADRDAKDVVENAINAELRRTEYADQGLDFAKIQRVEKTHVRFVSLNAKKGEGEEEVSMADQIRQWAPVGFVYLLWIGIFAISQMLLNNTIEEKSNRIIEVLLSSVTARELMMGKLLGIACVGLTMLATWIVSLLAVVLLKAGPEAELANAMFEVLTSSGLLPAFAIYFFFGYLMYAGMFLTIGSVCNTLKEAQNLMGPVMIIMIVPVFTMMFIPKDPNGTLATVLSWIPIYTPFIMMNRAAADPPWIDVIGTGALMIGFTALILYLTGKIFRIGILRTGQPPKIKELLGWLR